MADSMPTDEANGSTEWLLSLVDKTLSLRSHAVVAVLKRARKQPLETIKAINKVLGPRFVTRYGTRQGVVVLGRSLPFGVGAAIGGVGNYLMGRTVVSATRRAFGPAPESWPGSMRI